MWTWRQDREAAGWPLVLFPWEKFVLICWLGGRRRRLRQAKMVTQAKQLLDLTSYSSLFWVAGTCFCLFVCGCIYIVSTSPLSLFAPWCCSNLFLVCGSICMPSYTNHKHTHSLSASSCCFHRLCLLPSYVDSDQMWSNAFSSSLLEFCCVSRCCIQFCSFRFVLVSVTSLVVMFMHLVCRHVTVLPQWELSSRLNASTLNPIAAWLNTMQPRRKPFVVGAVVQFDC